MESENFMHIDNNREKLIEIFEDTMRLCRENAELSEAIKYTQENTKYYVPDEYPERKAAEIRQTEVNVTAETHACSCEKIVRKAHRKAYCRAEFCFRHKSRGRSYKRQLCTGGSTLPLFNALSLLKDK